MNKDQAIKIIELAITETTSKQISFPLDKDAHLLDDHILDSVESFIFPRRLEDVSGIAMPDGDDITKAFYSVSGLVEYLINSSSI